MKKFLVRGRYKSFYIIILVLASFSCNLNKDDCKKISLSKGDLEWFKAYKKGDTVVFECQKTKLRDSFIVVSSNNYYTKCNKIEFGDEQYNYATMSLRLLKSGKIDYHGNSIQIEFSTDFQTSSIVSSTKSFLVFDLSFDFKDLNKLSSDTLTLTTGRKDYPVYHFSSNNSISNDLNGGVLEIESFYWNVKHGLLRYDKGSGEVFEILSTLREDK